MSTLGINLKGNNNQLKKTIWVYLGLSAAAVAIDQVYGVFSHGVDSVAMTWMFLFPLLGGALFYFIIQTFLSNKTRSAGFRIFANIYNSGIAALTLASLLKGILEIAGTDSPYLKYFYLSGELFIAAGLLILLIIAIKTNKNTR